MTGLGTAGHDGDAHPGQEGFATVAAAGSIAVLVVLLGLLLQLGAVVASRHGAERAADLAALAGAGGGVLGPEVGCARAAAVATANGASLLECAWSGWTVSVRVTRLCSCPLPVSMPSSGRARAGPVGLGEPR